MKTIADQFMRGKVDYPVNQWYVIACSHEVTQTPITRMILGEPVALFRTEDGTPVALFDRCPHRGIQLSRGKIIGNAIQCSYHGIEFDNNGQCIKIPSSPVIPEKLCVRSYPVVESWKWIWIWMGQQDQADPEQIPNLFEWGFGKDGWHSELSAVFNVRANYLLLIENLLDASHISFLHSGQLDSGLVASHPFTIDEKGKFLSVHRHIKREKQGSLTMKAFGFEGEYADRTIIADAIVPALCGIRVIISPCDQPGTKPQINQLAVGITPRDPSSCYEFTAVAQTFPFVNDGRHNDLRKLLMEDIEAMENIQKLNSELSDKQLVEFSIKSDEAAMRARRIIDRSLAAENM